MIALSNRRSLPHSADSWLLVGIVLFAAVLRFANLQAVGDGNLYYTAAVKSMMASPSNFFYAAAEYGGSVTVDKPPVGLWLQVLSAAVFGVNGFGVVLPQILTGILAVPLLYFLTRRYFGVVAGLIASFVLAVSPIDIATARNNTMDATLVLFLLLAAWAFMRATETGRLRWLIAGGVLVGVAFNVKMLQAFLPAPAFFALYLFAGRATTLRRLIQLFIAGATMLAVSLSWALVVDAVPPDQRPYIGSSSDNTVMDLITGYNGLERLLGRAITSGGTPTAPPPLAQFGSPLTTETGSPGWLRLFVDPLANDSGWLLPFALMSMVILAVTIPPRCTLWDQHKGLILWGGWLLTAIFFFSRAEFYHAYYLVMLTPAIGALVGGGVGALWTMSSHRPRTAGIALLVAATLSAAYQYATAQGYFRGQAASLWRLTGIILLALAIIPALSARSRAFTASGFVLAALSLLAIPAAWGAATTFDAHPDANLPHAWEGNVTAISQIGSSTPPTADPEFAAYLQAHTQDTRYLVAVPAAMIGAPLVLATGRPVLYMGGFGGNDPVVDPAELSALVAAGDLRYVINIGRSPDPNMRTRGEIAAWIQANCAPVVDPALPFGAGGGSLLWECRTR